MMVLGFAGHGRHGGGLGGVFAEKKWERGGFGSGFDQGFDWGNIKRGGVDWAKNGLGRVYWTWEV